MIPAALLLITSFFLKLIIFTACFLNSSQKNLIQFLPLRTSCLLSMLLNEDTLDIEKPGKICSLTLVADEF